MTRHTRADRDLAALLADASPEHTTFVVRLPIHGAQSADQPAKK